MGIPDELRHAVGSRCAEDARRKKHVDGVETTTATASETAERAAERAAELQARVEHERACQEHAEQQEKYAEAERKLAELMRDSDSTIERVDLERAHKGKLATELIAAEASAKVNADAVEASQLDLDKTKRVWDE